MPLVAAAVCPHPPLIVPEVAGDAAPELDELRVACDAAVARMLAAAPELVVVVGDGPETTGYGPADRGSLRPYGVDWAVQLGGLSPPASTATLTRRSATGTGTATSAGAGAGQPLVGRELPLGVQIGAWLLHRAGAGDRPRAGQAVSADTPPVECARLGAALVDPAGQRIALLVMGDGTACRGEKAPGYDDPRARSYDDAVARALAGVDAEELLALEPGLAAELRVAGRAPWQVLAGAVRATGGDWRGDLSYHAAPYGVAYLVANWEPA